MDGSTPAATAGPNRAPAAAGSLPILRPISGERAKSSDQTLSAPQGENKRQNLRPLRQPECPATTSQIPNRICLNEELFLPDRHGRNKPPDHPPSNGRVENLFWSVACTPSSCGRPERRKRPGPPGRLRWHRAGSVLDEQFRLGQESRPKFRTAVTQLPKNSHSAFRRTLTSGGGARTTVCSNPAPARARHRAGCVRR